MLDFDVSVYRDWIDRHSGFSRSTVQVTVTSSYAPGDRGGLRAVRVTRFVPGDTLAFPLDDLGSSW